jgi:tRNA(Ile)-lysidine synthase
MHKFVRSLLTEWRKLKLPFDDETVIVAVSGGADSVSLLLALHELTHAKKIRLKFIVGHFNHNLRGADSEKDADFVRDLSKKLEIEYEVGLQNPESKIQNQKGNLEQLARIARYEFLNRIAEKHQAYGVLMAHTLNDQAETFLLNLIRGSGRSGLSAMKTNRKLNAESETRLIRPLLNWAERKDTEDFALEQGIEFRLDSMNEDEKFARVKIRKKIIPLLREFNPKIVGTLAQTAILLQENTENLTFDTGDLPESLPVKDLKGLSTSVLYGVLRAWLLKRRGDLRQIDLKHVRAIESLIFSQKSGRIAELPGSEAVIKKQGKLFHEKRKVEKSRSDI